MSSPKPERQLTRRQERLLLKAAAAAIESDYPNAERRECPAGETVRHLAKRRIPLEATGELVDHIATCSACFDAYCRYRRQRKFARAAGTTLLATILLLSLTLVLRHRSAYDFSPQKPIMRMPVAPILSATIDFRKSSPTRSSDSESTPTGTAVLPNAVVNLTVFLPFGGEDGEYVIEVRSPSGDAIRTTSGTAKWDGTNETLTAVLDLRQLAPGNYLLALRKGEASWRSYPLVLEEKR